MSTAKQFIDTAKHLIRIPSTADNPAALRQAMHLLADIISQRRPHVTIEWFESNNIPSFIAYRGPKRPEIFDIILNAHVDVVPATDPTQYTPTVKNGRLYGRGALDMKGTASVLVHTFCDLIDTVDYALGLQIVCDEEVGGYNGVVEQITKGIKTKFAIMGEYSNERHTIYNAARGLCWAEIKFNGKSAHGAHLWHGNNAVIKAGDFAGAVLKHYPTPDRETWTTTASIASLSTPNQTFNKVPDTAILKIDFRFTQEDPVFADRESFAAFVRHLDPEAEIVNVATFEPAVDVHQLNPYVQGLAAAVREIGHVEPNFLGRPGGSDGRHYALISNDIVEYGLFGKHSHGTDEYVELTSFAEYAKILSIFLKHPIPVELIHSAPTGPNNIQLLRELIAIPSITTDTNANDRLLGFIERYLSQRGLSVTRYEHNGVFSLLATTIPNNLEPSILLSAHCDVVPAEPTDFELRIEQDTMYGRGVYDMKYAIAAYLNLIDQLKNDDTSYDLGILITSDEEVGGQNGVGYMVEHIGLRPGVAIVPDGGDNWQIESFAKGAMWLKLEAQGKGGPGSRPWEGRSAISMLLDTIRSIEQLIPHSEDKHATTINIGTIQGGSTGNQIATSANALIDIRFGNIKDYEQLPNHISALCERHGVDISVLVSSAPHQSDPDDPAIKAFAQTIASVTGEQPGTSYSYGITDGRYFTACGTPCIVVSPKGGGRHASEEWLSKRSFDQFCSILHQHIRQHARAKRQTTPLVSDTLPEYVWFAAYGTGLIKSYFIDAVIAGGRPTGSRRSYPGISDTTPPRDDTFIALPYQLYFAGDSIVWGGGAVHLNPQYDPNAHTIAHAYLVTRQQYEDLAAAQNWLLHSKTVPYHDAMRDGQAIINGPEEYNLLLHCGTKQGYPIFALTSAAVLPAVKPSSAYTKLLCVGLSSTAAIDSSEAIRQVQAEENSLNPIV